MVRKAKPRKAKAKTTPARKRPAKKAQASGPSAEELRTYVRTESERFLKDPNITSVGVGYKQSAGKRTKQLAIQFTVGKKVPESSVESLRVLDTNVIPKTVQIGKHVVPTDVLERTFKAGYEVLEAPTKDPRKQRLQTLVPGVSVSHPKGTAGTLGLIVYDRRDTAPCVLSNWHVLHTPDGNLGDDMVQPGPFDDNRVAQNRAGTLLRSHLGSAGDCAIARIEGRGVDEKILDLGVTVKKLARPELDDRVVKSGRTTGVTFGIVTRVDTVTKIDYEGNVGEQLIGGFEIGPDPKRPPKNGEVSMGGDSGSAWLIANPNGKPSDVMVGLHFAGEGEGDPDEHAVACYAHSVFEKLEVDLEPATATEAAAAEALGSGYDENFLGLRVALPTLERRIAADTFRLQGSPHIPYTHFTVALSKSRRMARFVAWNIDGGRLQSLSRKSLKFRLDDRVPDNFQIDDEAYSDNKLDRGHIARRADLVWGTSEEAARANRESFYFTNITPQHQAFNQSQRHGLWGMLENAVFEDVDVKNLRIAVLGGPLFKTGDIEYRGVRVPSDFWKVVAFIDDEDDQLKAKAYVLTQENLLDDLEALELDPFRLYQVSLAELESRSDLDFGTLKQRDDFRTGRVPEAVGRGGRRRPVREVHSRADLVV